MRYVMSMFMSFIATFVLFLIMAILITNTLEPPKKKPIIHANLLTDETINPDKDLELRLKRKTRDVRLLQSVELPPEAVTKTVIVDWQKPKLATSNMLTAKYDPRQIFTPQAPQLAKLPSHPQSQSNRKGRSTNYGNGGFGAKTGGTGGPVKCIVGFTVGQTVNVVKDLYWKDCINTDTINAAEAAVYDWVETGDDTYLKLSPKPGDIIEFIYEKI
ncbi:MAG: hypothetical protein ACPGVT_13000 [Maricaulaceae bacterium]